jgi:hypothetical protein
MRPVLATPSAPMPGPPLAARRKMVERSRIALLTGALASIALPYLSGCTQRTYQARPLPPPRGLSLCGATPDFYDYYYYPQDEVYFHIRSGDYFYRDDGIWWRVRYLPAYFYLDPGDRVCLRIMDVQPWRYHYAVRGRYPPRPRPYAYYDYWYYPHPYRLLLLLPRPPLAPDSPAAAEYPAGRPAPAKAAYPRQKALDPS